MVDHEQHNRIVNFIWNIADDVLHHVYTRAKYRDVILPMTVLRRLDSLLESSKDDVIKLKAQLDEAGVAEQEAALCQVSGQAFYNISPFTLKRLLDSPKQIKANFQAYLDGFSPNVQEIISKFELRDKLKKLDESDRLGSLIEKFVSPTINLSPQPVFDGQGNVRLPGLDNHSMGTVFEELVRRFNEDNNEDAGEHFTPRDAVRLMANLIFRPIANDIESGTYLLYDCACGTGGMLTEAEETLLQIAEEHGKQVSIHLYGQESQPETYAICKSDLLLKGEGDEARNIRDKSTLSDDAFPSMHFDFMLANPPYGTSWKEDLDRLCSGNKKEMRDPRFVVEHAGDPEFSLVTRSNDGQMMFLVNMLSKMKHGSKLGSRIAEVHNGSSLFTGDAGQGESNIRRWIIENDWLEAIIALPLNFFYNTGIATYIWVLTNRKPANRKGKVQLIDATEWSAPLRKNLGKKNCTLTDEHIRRICEVFTSFAETEQSKIFPNDAFGYWKITVQRPLRLTVDLGGGVRARFRRLCIEANEEPLANLIDRVAKQMGEGPHKDFNQIMAAVKAFADDSGVKLTSKREKLIQAELAQRDESAAPVVRKKTKAKKGDEADPFRGRYMETILGTPYIVEYETDSELKDTEQIGFLEDGGIEGFFRREVLPHAKDAWIDEDETKIGYEVSFTRYFYKPQRLRTLDEIKAEILALEKETEGILGKIVGGGN